MTNKTFTPEEKLIICETFAALAEDVDTYKSLIPIVKKCGEAVGKTVAYYTIREQWLKEDQELGALIMSGLLARAEAYVEKAEKEMEALETKASTYYDMWVSSGGQCREMMTAVNVARFRIERYERLTSLLAPEVYGDYYYQIKKCEEQIKEVTKRLDEMGKR